MPWTVTMSGEQGFTLICLRLEQEFPWASGVGVVLEIYQLRLGTLQLVVLCMHAFDQLWISTIASICCKNDFFFGWGVSSILICEYKGAIMESGSSSFSSMLHDLTSHNQLVLQYQTWIISYLLGLLSSYIVVSYLIQGINVTMAPLVMSCHAGPFCGS